MLLCMRNDNSQKYDREVPSLRSRVDQADGGKTGALPWMQNALLGHEAWGVANGTAAEEISELGLRVL
jgi:hypothetical protein